MAYGYLSFHGHVITRIHLLLKRSTKVYGFRIRAAVLSDRSYSTIEARSHVQHSYPWVYWICHWIKLFNVRVLQWPFIRGCNHFQLCQIAQMCPLFLDYVINVGVQRLKCCPVDMHAFELTTLPRDTAYYLQMYLLYGNFNDITAIYDSCLLDQDYKRYHLVCWLMPYDQWDWSKSGCTA